MLVFGSVVFHSFYCLSFWAQVRNKRSLWRNLRLKVWRISGCYQCLLDSLRYSWRSLVPRDDNQQHLYSTIVLMLVFCSVVFHSFYSLSFWARRRISGCDRIFLMQVLHLVCIPLFFLTKKVEQKSLGKRECSAALPTHPQRPLHTCCSIHLFIILPFGEKIIIF